VLSGRRLAQKPSHFRRSRWLDRADEQSILAQVKNVDRSAAAEKVNDQEVAAMNLKRLPLYRLGQPYRDTP
jgi:hypothetical protein